MGTVSTGGVGGVGGYTPSNGLVYKHSVFSIPRLGSRSSVVHGSVEVSVTLTLKIWGEHVHIV